MMRTGVFLVRSVRNGILFVFVLAAALAAQDLGMGTRQGSGKRFEEPYTMQVETQHVKWARPFPGGPIRLLAVPTVSEGRTLVELAERLSLDLTTVSIDPDWDVNKWTMSFGADYGARAEKGDLSLVHSYLEEELTGPKKFDVILLPMYQSWESMKPAAREALARRVREGCGLVLIRPFASELSPVSPIGLNAQDSELSEPADPGKTEPADWRRTADHYITRAIPIESFPFSDLSNFIYRTEPGAKVLVESKSGHPVVAVKQFGKGRVVSFMYRNEGLSWYMPMAARGHFTGVYWEYFYSMLCRSLIWAVGREPARVDFNAGDAEWRLRDSFGTVRQSGRGRAPQFAGLAPGRYFLEQQAAGDWQISPVEVQQPDRIEELSASPAVIAEGGTVEVKWRSTRPAKIALLDGFGREIARGEGANSVRLTAGRPLTHSGFVRATCGTVVSQVPVRFAASSREWNDYEVIMPWFGPHSYQPWIDTLDEQFRRVGITALADPERNFKMIVSAHVPGFGIYWYRRDGYVARKAEFAKTKDKRYLVREIPLESPRFDADLRAQLEKTVRPLAPLNPLAYYLADESSVTFYADAFDVDWSPESLAGLRVWLRQQYGSLEKLNATWGTAFRDWSAVVPMTTEEAQAHGDYAPWADHRAYMEHAFIEAFRKASAAIHEVDPGGRASISGTQVPTPHNGANWYEIDQQIDYLQPYSDGSQDAMHYLFRPGLIITGFTGYELVGTKAQYQQWQRLFYGHRGASIFWHYTLLNPDLTLSPQGSALAEAFGRIQSGIGRVFMNSTVHEDGVAIHFSPASLRGAWITDGKISAGLANASETSKAFAELGKRREEWVKELERHGTQFRFLATPQIEAGALDKYRVLILPYSTAISDAEAREIERFMARGGVVYGDEHTGRMDERCRLRPQQLWADGRKGFVRSGPREVGAAHEFGSGSLVTIRDFGASELTGVLPRESAEVQAPAGNGIIYDLFEGGIAKPRVQAGPARPALFLLRAKRIAKLTIDPTLQIRLADESGHPVDLSVVRVEVRDPTGRLARLYTGNVTVRDGKAKFEIPFALSDASGTWTVRARDVVSGLTAETRVVR
jgi:hypothetical protein